MNLFRRVFLVATMVLSIVVLPQHAHAAGMKTFDTEDQVIAYLGKQKGKDIKVEFSCDKALYQDLVDDDYREFFRMLLVAGIDAGRARAQSSDTDCSFKLTYNFSDSNVYKCATTADVASVLSDVTETNSIEDALVLVCSDELYDTLDNDKDFIYYTAAKYGIADLYVKYRSTYAVIEVSDMEALDKDYAYVEDYAQFASAVSHFAEEDLTEFFVAFSRDLFDTITTDKSERTIMIGSSQIENYAYVNKGKGGILKFYAVEYTDVARTICHETSELTAIFSQMGASGITEFEILFPYKEVFEEISANDFEKLHEIEAKAGMKSSKMSYSLSGDRISYEEADIASEATALNSLDQAIAYTEQLVDAGETKIDLFCTEQLYDELLGDLTSSFVLIPDGMNRIYDLLVHAGVADYELSTFPATHVISICVKQLFPGKAIVLAERTKDTSSLTKREKKARKEALKIAKKAKDADPLKAAKYIHDWLCTHVAYVDDESTDEDDNAIGAILNGEANCDGYTDAFYLIGTLAGLDVRYQHGDSYQKDASISVTPVTHVWNLLKVDDAWHMVDVTWDDFDSSPVYVWFNVGDDVASLTHIWNSDMTVALDTKTERVYRADNEYYAADVDDIQGIVREAKEDRQEEFLIVVGGAEEDAVLEAVRDNIEAARYGTSWNDQLDMVIVSDVEWEAA